MSAGALLNIKVPSYTLGEELFNAIPRDRRGPQRLRPGAVCSCAPREPWLDLRFRFRRVHDPAIYHFLRLSRPVP